MLEQPCGVCGRMLDVNEAVCPACGMARHRTARRPPHAGFTALMAALALTLLGGIIGWVCGAMATLAHWDAAIPEGSACLGGLLGAAVGVVVYRRLQR